VKYALFALFISLSCPAHADDWTSTDTKLLAGALALQVIDWGQTRDMVRRPQIEDFHENNPLLGKNPSIGRVDRYFALRMAGTVGLSYALPQRYRRWFLGGMIVIDSLYIINNHQIGLRAEF
jgi:hypothetical protein